jgi:hypothetical protein
MKSSNGLKALRFVFFFGCLALLIAIGWKMSQGEAVMAKKQAQVHTSEPSVDGIMPAFREDGVRIPLEEAQGIKSAAPQQAVSPSVVLTGQGAVVTQQVTSVAATTSATSASASPASSTLPSQDQMAALLSQRHALGDPQKRMELVRQLRAAEDAEMQGVLAKAKRLGLPTEGQKKDGGRFALVGFDGDRPLYQQTENVNAAISTSANLVRSVSPYNVDGAGWTMGLWEAGGVPRVTHQEFGLPTRVTVRDGYTIVSDHATHVAGTLAAAGLNSSLKGMAPGLLIDAYSSGNATSEMTAAGAAYGGEPGKIYVSNHSYGFILGWDGNDWYGAFTNNGDRSDDVETFFGRYNSNSVILDGMMASLPYYLSFWSAGNQRNDGPPSTGATWYDGPGGPSYTYDPVQHPAGDGQYKIGYDTLDSTKVCKNVMTVGAVEDAVNAGVRSLSAAVVTSFSSTGPTDDGRIKPDVVANGASLTSTGMASDTDTSVSSGTSMSSPNAAGSAMLLVDYYGDRFPGKYMTASTLKALIIHNADDIGNPGPDYFYGWGLMDTKAAADHIKREADDDGYNGMIEAALSTANPADTYQFTWDGVSPIRVTLCWTDPAGASVNAHDDRARDLVNDLNLSVSGPGGSTHRPFVMPYVGNWTNAMLSANAVTGINTVDNVEQVLVTSPPVAGLYTINVNFAGALSGGSQAYSLIISGQVQDALTVEANTVWQSVGTIGGPFTPSTRIYTLSNTGSTSLNWTVQSSQAWVAAAVPSGTLPTGNNVPVTVSLTSAANSLAVGTHTAELTFTNSSTNFTMSRFVILNVTLPTPPNIVDQPQGLTVDVGESAEFSVFATGGNLTYQWQKNTVDIPGATSATFSISVTDANSAGSYRCVVTNNDGVRISQPAVLTVVTPPVITASPINQVVDEGQTATLTVSATGLFLSYQWQKNDAVMPGRTDASLVLTNVTTLDTASYRCVVTNTAGTATSDPGTLTVSGKPNITQHPLTRSIVAGQPTLFEVQAVGPGLTYIWQKEGEDIPSATSASYSITSTIPANAGNYRCVVTNSFGFAVSTPANLIVITPPVITAPIVARSISTKVGLPVTLSVNATGLNLVYQWRKNDNDIPLANTPTFSITSAVQGDSGVYRCRVSNAADVVFSPAVTLTVLQPPIITAHPVTVTAVEGQPASFSVTATGAVSYQWLRNGSPVTGAVSATYSIPSVSVTNLGEYLCEVTNTGGSVRSLKALLAIEGMPIITRPPFPVLAELGAPLSLDMEALGDNLSYSWKRNGTVVSNQRIFDGGPMTAKLAGQYVGQVSNAINSASTLPVPVAVVSDLSPALDAATIKWSTTGHAFWRVVTGIQTKDGKDGVVSSTMLNGQKSTLSTRLTGPLKLEWWQKVSSEEDKDLLKVYVDGVEVAAASGELDWHPASTTIGVGPHLVEFTYAKDISDSVGQDRAWLDGFAITPSFAPTGVAEERLVKSGTNVVINASYDGTPQTFQWRRNKTAITGATSAQLVLNGITTAQAGSYDCVFGAVGNGLKLSQIGVTTQIGVVNGNGSVVKLKGGSRTTFTATAVGKDLQYQWKRNGTELLGQKDSKLTLSFLQTFDTGDYVCAVSNAGGEVNAGTNTLLIYDSGPAITLAGDLPPAIVGGAYYFQVPYDLNTDRTPTLFKVNKLPAGLVINKLTGEITGIPTAGSLTPFEFQITASNDFSPHTVSTSILVKEIPLKTGQFIGVLPRHSVLNDNLGGRIDFTVSSKGSLSGTLTLGVLKHSFSGQIVTSLSHEAEAHATITVSRGKAAPLALSFTVTDDQLLTNGVLSLGAESLSFNGWRNPWGKTAPANSLAGSGLPVGFYTFGLDLPAPLVGAPDTPQGSGFGTLSIDKTTGIATVAGRLSEDTAFTSTTLASLQGKVPVFALPYTGGIRGSLVGVAEIDVKTNADDNNLGGSLSWWRSGAAKERVFKNAFATPIDLIIEGGRYIVPIAPSLVLGLTETGANVLDLTFSQGGIGSPPPSPNLTLSLISGNRVTYPVLNPRKTSLSILAPKGSFSGNFTLEDNDPLDTRPPPAVLRKLTRKVNYQGVLVRQAVGWRGVGYFMLPELPDVIGETLTNTQIHSGKVLLAPVPVAP